MFITVGIYIENSDKASKVRWGKWRCA